jgi:hypothetical protein
MLQIPAIGRFGQGSAVSSGWYGLGRRGIASDNASGLVSPERCRIGAQGARLVNLAVPPQVLETLMASDGEVGGVSGHVTATASSQDRGPIGAVDGAGHSLNILLAGLIVQILDSPFCVS